MYKRCALLVLSGAGPGGFSQVDVSEGEVLFRVMSGDVKRVDAQPAGSLEGKITLEAQAQEQGVRNL